MYNNIMTKEECQVSESEKKLLQKLAIKKSYNKVVFDFLVDQGEKIKAERLKECATYIEIVRETEQPKIVRANFCRERMCNVCAWRKQSKFVATISPVLEKLSNDGYEYLFVTLTLKNVKRDEVGKTLDLMMKSYNKFLGRKKIELAFEGAIRSLEITYNAESNTFHPHIHILAAVRGDYFSNPKRYISQRELCSIWKECIGENYTPVCHIEKVTSSSRAEVETLKYCIKPSKERQALEVFFKVLKGRRLVSFSGIFARYRKAVETAEEVLTDNVLTTGKPYEATCYKFDVTGGVYAFYNKSIYVKEE